MISYFNRNKWTSVAFVLLVILNLITLAAFWLMYVREPRYPAGRQPGMIDFLVKELQLNTDQEKQLMLLRDEHRQQMEEIRRHNRDAKNVFFDLLEQQGDMTDSALAEAVKQAVRYDAETDMLTFRHFQKIRALCNEEQKARFHSILRQVLQMMAPPPGNQQPPPPHGRGENPGPPMPGREGREPPPPPHQK